jgi:carbamoyl-phosphate synthase large subunit
MEAAGIPAHRLNKLSEGRPNVLDMIKNGEIAFIVNTPSGQQTRQDERRIRSAAVQYHVSHCTNLSSASATLTAIAALQSRPMEVRTLQEFQA